MAVSLVRRARAGLISRRKDDFMNRDNKDGAEARRIIDRVGAESEASMARRVAERVTGHMAGRDVGRDGGGDRIELWGTRIGRWLGAGLLVYVIWWLVDFSSGGG